MHPFVPMCLFAFVAACSSQQADVQPPRVIGVEVPLPTYAGPPTQYRTDEEQTSRAKADALETTRALPEIYGVTEPPSVGSRLLPEWAGGASVLVAWYEPLAPYFSDLIVALSVRESVWVLTESATQTEVLRSRLVDAGASIDNIQFFEYVHEAFWARDFGPWSLVDPQGKITFFDAKYYPTRFRDDATPTLLADYFGIDVVRPKLAAEGGNMMTNGAGLCVTTTRLTYNNPPRFSFELDADLDRWLGCRRTVYLEPLNDERTGHVDLFAKFLGPDVVMVAQYDSELDPENARITDDAAKILSEIRLSDGRALRIVRVLTPPSEPNLHRSYTNSLLSEHAVYVPIYSGANALNARALETYRVHLADAIDVVPIDASALIEFGGAVHCSTMQVHLDAPTDPLDRRFVPLDWMPPKHTLSTVANSVVRRGESKSFQLAGQFDPTSGILGKLRLHIVLEGRTPDYVTLTLTQGDESVLLFDGQNSRGQEPLPESFSIDHFNGQAETSPWVVTVTTPPGAIFSVGVRYLYLELL